MIVGDLLGPEIWSLERKKRENSLWQRRRKKTIKKTKDNKTRKDLLRTGSHWKRSFRNFLNAFFYQQIKWFTYKTSFVSILEYEKNQISKMVCFFVNKQVKLFLTFYLPVINIVLCLWIKFFFEAFK